MQFTSSILTPENNQDITIKRMTDYLMPSLPALRQTLIDLVQAPVVDQYRSLVLQAINKGTLL
jgi:phosphoribulokinase